MYQKRYIDWRMVRGTHGFIWRFDDGTRDHKPLWTRYDLRHLWESRWWTHDLNQKDDWRLPDAIQHIDWNRMLYYTP